MINIGFVAVILVVIAIYAGLNYYIGLRAWQALGSFTPFLNQKVYWLVFGVIALAYLAGRLRFLPGVLSRWLTVIGAYWLAVMVYAILALVVIDLVRLLNRWLHFLPDFVHAPGFSLALGLTVCLLVIGVVAYGAWNARNPRVQHYDITLNKQAGNLKQLHIVMVSDIHLGTIVRNGQLDKMVSMVNNLHPDIILFPGDVIDESVEQFVEQQMADRFKRLKAPYGVYAVPGNHEYIGGHVDEIVKYLDAAGVQVLRDRSVKVADSFYLVGRDDLSGQRFTGHKRQALTGLLSGVDRNLPVIVLDHQPSHLAEPEQAGVDLQLSGHTHRGQLFPGELITQRIFEDAWGYLHKGNFQLIVSSGYGTWGPPVRIASQSEVVDITVHFKQ